MTMSPSPKRVLTEDEIDARLAEVTKGQQLAGHHPDSDALDRARRLLTDKITVDEAYAEIDAKLYE